MGKYRFESRLIKGVIKSRPNRFIMMVDTGGSIVKCHCPSTGRIGGIVFDDVACLLSRSKNPNRKTEYTVEAISLDPISKKEKSWIGINQGRANEYIGYFLGNGELGEIVGDSTPITRESKVGNCRIDFRAGDTYIEVKTPLINLPSGGKAKTGNVSAFDSFDRLIKHFGCLGELAGKGSKAVIILCYMFDAEAFRPPAPDRTNRRIIKSAREAASKGVENWQANLRIDADGVEMLRYFRLRLFGED